MSPIIPEIWDKMRGWVMFSEGLRLTPYWDVSQYSVGYGHKLPPDADHLLDITKEVAVEWLDLDLKRALNDCHSITVFDGLDDARKVSLVEMCYNLGLPRLMGFTNMLGALGRNDWSAAKTHALTSRWATQVAKRSIRIAEQLKTGVITDPPKA